MKEPIPSSGTSTDALAVLHAHKVATVAYSSLLEDTRYASLQQHQAPIAYIDVQHPFPLPTHPAVPLPGDPGGYGTAAGLEDQ